MEEIKYVNTQVAARALGVTTAAICYRCRNKLIPGARRSGFGNGWMIPADSLDLEEVKNTGSGKKKKEKGK